jgi:hypothetical protein
MSIAHLTVFSHSFPDIFLANLLVYCLSPLFFAVPLHLRGWETFKRSDDSLRDVWEVGEMRKYVLVFLGQNANKMCIIFKRLNTR